MNSTISLKKTTLLLLAVLSYWQVMAQTDTAATVTKVGDAAPVFSFEPEKGRQASLADYKGRLILINLFATWCPPCRLELPQLQKQVWERYKDHPQFSLFVFGREENWDVLEPFKKKFNYGFPILPDPDRAIFSRFATQSIPRNILIDETGTIIYQSVGYEKAEFEKLVELIEKKLKKQ